MLWLIEQICLGHTFSIRPHPKMDSKAIVVDHSSSSPQPPLHLSAFPCSNLYPGEEAKGGCGSKDGIKAANVIGEAASIGAPRAQPQESQS